MNNHLTYNANNVLGLSILIVRFLPRLPYFESENVLELQEQVTGHCKPNLPFDSDVGSEV